MSSKVSKCKEEKEDYLVTNEKDYTAANMADFKYNGSNRVNLHPNRYDE
jgi:hypothetical protein